MKVFTIGFTKKTAKEFFGKLRDSQVRSIIDVRLNNLSQLAAFAKRDDLKFFLDEICGIDYYHVEILAPTEKMLSQYKKKTISWDIYEQKFLDLIESRKIEQQIPDELLERACLLCSEHLPHKCHRRLVVEYLKDHGRKIDVQHLM